MDEISGMTDANWRSRIEAALQRDGRSMRDISLAANLSHGYLHGILRDGKEPTLDRFAKICEELNVSLAYALVGLEMSPETERLIGEIEGSPGKRAALLSILSKQE